MTLKEFVKKCHHEFMTAEEIVSRLPPSEEIKVRGRYVTVTELKVKKLLKQIEEDVHVRHEQG